MRDSKEQKLIVTVIVLQSSGFEIVRALEDATSTQFQDAMRPGGRAVDNQIRTPLTEHDEHYSCRAAQIFRAFRC